jgi:DNA-binding transcriptional LysR family regulator
MLPYEFVGLQPGSLVNTVLSGVAARTGKSVDYRIHVTTFEAATAIVAANLAICVIPSEAARAYEASRGLRVIPLAEDWARREIVLCVRDYESLPVHGRDFVDHLRACGAARRAQRQT